MKVTEVRDNGGKTLDRYTIFFNERCEYTGDYTCLGVSPIDHGMTAAFSQWDLSDLPLRDRKQCGKKIKFSDLPDMVRLHVRSRMGE